MVKENMAQVKKMLNDKNVSFDKFYDFLRDKDWGNWDNVNSEEIIRQYVAEMMSQGIHVSHIIRAIENNRSEEELYEIWLGNSMETPKPIRTKKDLYNALFN
jgi:hypothetical protein